MTESRTPIRAPIEGAQVVGGMTLEDLRAALEKTDPELVNRAAGEFKGIRDKLKSVVDVLDKHLNALDRHWTAGDDAREVKTQLRRLRESAETVTNVIQATSPATSGRHPSGIRPALVAYAETLKAFGGENVPKPATGVNLSKAAEEARSTGVKGMAGGAMTGAFFDGVGAVPGAVIGAVGGTVVGGVHSMMSGHEEEDRQAAEEHLRKLTQATIQANGNFPASLDTDIPLFTSGPLATNFNSDGWPDGLSDPTGAAGAGGSYDLASAGLGGDHLGLPDGAGPRGRDHGLDDDRLNGTEPGDTGLGATGSDGPGLNGTAPGGGTERAGGTDPGGGPGGAGTTVLPRPGPANDSDLGSSLASHHSGAEPAGYPAASSQSMDHGTHTGVGTGYGPGGMAGPAATVGPLASGVRSAGGTPMLPLLPFGGGRGEEEQERERFTHLLEDDDLFTSDRPVTVQRIDHSSKGKA